MTTPDPQLVREIARTAIRSLIAEQPSGKRYPPRSHVEVAMIEYGIDHSDLNAWPASLGAVYKAIASAQVTVSWPDEQAQAERDPKRCAHCQRNLAGASTHRIQGIRVCADIRSCLARQASQRAEQQAERDAAVRAVAEIVWLTQDDEGNFGVWRDPDNARQQIIRGYAAEIPGAYEWVNDTDRTGELLLRDGEMTGLKLWMACVADADLDARGQEGASCLCGCPLGQPCRCDDNADHGDPRDPEGWAR